MIKVKNNSPATGDNIKIIDEIVRRHNIHRGAAIPILQEIQTTFGFVPPEAITRISDLTGIAESELYSIVTFYAQFRLEPVGKNIICVCHGTACHLAGAEKVTEALQHATGARPGGTSPDGLFTLEKVACLGCCSLAPVMTVNGETVAKVTPEKARAVVKSLREAAQKNKTAKGGRP
ncbi:MAG: NADH-quinone oxidoreductase subunit NuoE [Bacillota bacterium]|jgi:NADH-quinone oxidoreductase subunit E|nr:NADH-quinone oxidoreductase subunit NuoE [Bacillota bacterium]HHU30350.1 NADH-quinone oxidoreductase subunit NuoE [Bacillota bacterium]